MHYEIVELPARTIVGPTVRTSNNSPEETTVIGQLWQRFMGEGLTAMTAPVFIATVVAIAATFLQVGWLMLRGRKVEPMLWISLAVIVVFGSLTLYLRNEMFIKWNPTILYWIFGGILVYGNFAGRNFIRMLLSKAEIEMPGHAWGTLQNMWIGFFAAMGVVNLLVAYLCSTDTWSTSSSSA